MPVTIAAPRFNTLRNLVNKILGTPTDVGYGYGETTLGNSVSSNTSVIDDEEYINLYKDILRIESHQTGSVAFLPFVQGDFATNAAATDKVEEAYIASLESKVATLESNRFDVDAAQLSIAPLRNSGNVQIASTRSLQWNSSISHIFTANFDNSSDLNAFFNAGGQIRPQLSLNYSGSEAKTQAWKVLFLNIGPIRVGGSTTRDGTGIIVNVGVRNLNTSSYTRLYVSASAASYVNNIVTLDAKLVSSLDAVQFKLTCYDAHGETIDEYVRGATTNIVSKATPQGDIQIDGQDYTTVNFTGNLTGSTISGF